MTEEQLAFDIEGMLHAAAVEAALEWSGAPLHFTTKYYPPAELNAAFEHWQFLHAHDETHVNSRMWRRSITVPEGDQVVGHGFVLYTTDLRCEHWKHADKHDGCTCLGDLIYQALCELCEWNGITDSENDAVEMWHDHALPGWRELPIVSSRLRRMDRTPCRRPRRGGSSSTTQSRCRCLARRSSPSDALTGHGTPRAARRGVATTSPTPRSILTESSKARSPSAGNATFPLEPAPSITGVGGPGISD